MQIIRVTKESQYWDAFIEYIERISDLVWFLNSDGDLIDNLHCIAVVEGSIIVGHISFRVQPITVPSVDWSKDDSFPLTNDNGRILYESFVNYFEVNKPYRRQGIGTALQIDALRLTSELGCIQMRSWSSMSDEAGNWANYALKLKLGFSVYPVTSESMNGVITRGVYFIKNPDTIINNDR